MKTIEEMVENCRSAYAVQYIDPNNEYLGEKGLYFYYFDDDYEVDHYGETYKFNSTEEMITHRFEDGTCLMDYLCNHDTFPEWRLYGDQKSARE